MSNVIIELCFIDLLCLFSVLRCAFSAATLLVELLAVFAISLSLLVGEEMKRLVDDFV